LTISLSDSFRETVGSFFLESITIEHSSGATGGGIALYNLKDLVISNSVIQNNSASLNGGGIYYYCKEVFACSLSLPGTTIRYNKAGNSGGGVFWNYVEPMEGEVNNNSAKVYG